MDSVPEGTAAIAVEMSRAINTMPSIGREPKDVDRTAPFRARGAKEGPRPCQTSMPMPVPRRRRWRRREGMAPTTSTESAWFDFCWTGHRRRRFAPTPSTGRVLQPHELWS